MRATADMVALHDALGGARAIWVGHDSGSPVAWAMASHHPARCRGVVNLCVPYLSRGFALPTVIPLVDRKLYPVERFPVGQWDYWLFYREHFALAARQFEADVEASFTALYRTASREAVGKPGISAMVRANGGWFGPEGHAPAMPRDDAMMSQADFDGLVAAFRATGFSGADAWYLNDAANLSFAAEAKGFGHLSLPALFLHATLDTACDTMHSNLADPMREDCGDLTEVVIDAGHMLMLERPNEVNNAIAEWLADKAFA